MALAQRGATVTGLDFVAHLLALARQHAAALAVSVNWIRGDMRALPLRDASVQAATVFDAFGFFDDDEENRRVLQELARVLAPGGRLATRRIGRIAAAIPTLLIDALGAEKREAAGLGGTPTR